MDPFQKRWIIAIAISSLALAFRKQIRENIHKATTSVETPPSKFDFYTLALRWPPAICKELDGKRCNTPVPNSDFTIHGLWPSNTTGDNPSNCSSEKFDPSQVKDIKPKLTAHWPNLFVNGSSVGFWSYQWKKHGTCAETKQLQYFDTPLRLRDTVNVPGNLAARNCTPNATPKYNPKARVNDYKEHFKVGLIINCVRRTPGEEMIAEIKFKVNKNGETVESFRPRTNCTSSEVSFPNE